MNSVNFFDRIANTGKGILEGASYTVQNSEALSKISALAIAILDMLGTLLSTFIPGLNLSILSNLKTGPNAVKSLIGATGIVVTTQSLVDPQERKGIKTPQKAIARVTLIPAQVLETIGFLSSTAIINIGILGSRILGNLSILAFVKNAFFTISSVFSIWDSAKSLNNPDSKSRTKLHQWQGLTDDQLRAHLAGKDKYGRDANVDIHAFKTYKENKYNAKIEFARKKTWVSIAADIAKIAIIVMSSIALALLVTIPVALVVIGVTAVASASLGYAKTMYGKFGLKEPENTLKVALARA